MGKKPVVPIIRLKEFNVERGKARRRLSKPLFFKTTLLLVWFFASLTVLTIIFDSKITCQVFRYVSVKDFGQESTRPEQKEPTLIFIGGPTDVGVELMSKLLNHQSEQVWCGSDAGVITHMLALHRAWNTSPKEKVRLLEAKMGSKVQSAAIRSFLWPLLQKIGKGFPQMCAVNPDLMTYSLFIHEIFPDAKFLFMVRDGRQTLYETVIRNKKDSSVKDENHQGILMNWNSNVTMQNQYCQYLGSRFCLRVKVEDVIENPILVMNQVLKFLNLLPAGETLKELDTHQMYLLKNFSSWTASHHWSHALPKETANAFRILAPMLKILNYTQPNFKFDQH